MCLERLVGERRYLACSYGYSIPLWEGVDISGHDFMISCIIFSVEGSAILLISELYEVYSVLRMQGSIVIDTYTWFTSPLVSEALRNTDILLNAQ
jgi:hypothetical protein